MSPAKTRIQVPAPSDSVARALGEAAELIKGSKTFLVLSHVEPDGDAIGSSLGLASILRSLGKTVTVFNTDPVPFNLSFLAGAGAVVHTLDDNARFDVACVLDVPSPQRLGGEEWRRGERLLVIDHHSAVFPEGDVVVHDPTACAVGELLFHLAVQLGVRLDQACAECLYCSVIADTGGFRYSCTTPVALATAAALLEYGVDVWRLSSQMFESNPEERIRLLGTVLGTLDIRADGRLGSIRIMQAALDQARIPVDVLTDGFINYARGVAGVEVAAQLLELDSDHYQVTLRSKGVVDVGRMARELGGGGGRNGAMYTMNGTWGHVLRQLARELEALWEEVGEAT